VLLARIEASTTNGYGKRAHERELILRDLAEVEPLLRATCTHEIDASRPIGDVVAELLASAVAQSAEAGGRAQPRLTMSTEISTAGTVPLFSSQCVVLLSSGQPRPGP
jgi:hypothetical protein